MTLRATTAVIVTWNSAGTLEPCLQSLRSSTCPVGAVVVDNGSRDTSAAVGARHADVHLSSPRNVGFAKAVNSALTHVSTGYLLLLNPDVILEPTTLSRCTELLEQTGAGIVGANLRTPDGDPDRAAARRFKSMLTVLIETLGLPRLSRRFDWQYFPNWDRSDSREVPCVNGAFMLIRTDLLKELGGLDDSVFMYLEDLDLCWRVRERGLPIWFCADAVATHVGGASTAAGNADQQSIAHLHRLDGTLEFITRTRRFGKRPILVGMLIVQSLSGVLLGVVNRDRVQVARHRRALRWLPRQLRGRTPPPPVPS